MKKTLEQLRAEAFAAFDAHQQDVKNDPVYARVSKKLARQAARRAARDLQDNIRDERMAPRRP